MKIDYNHIINMIRNNKEKNEKISKNILTKPEYEYIIKPSKETKI